jgi:hypothetical protein
MNANVLEIGEAYLNALDRKDISKITSLVDLNIRLKMPMGEFSNRNDFIMAIRRMLANSNGVHIIAKFASENQAMFIYEIYFNDPVGTVKTASLITVEGDKIKDIEVFFDARPFERVYSASSALKNAA